MILLYVYLTLHLTAFIYGYFKNFDIDKDNPIIFTFFPWYKLRKKTKRKKTYYIPVNVIKEEDTDYGTITDGKPYIKTEDEAEALVYLDRVYKPFWDIDFRDFLLSINVGEIEYEFSYKKNEGKPHSLKIRFESDYGNPLNTLDSWFLSHLINEFNMLNTRFNNIYTIKLSDVYTHNVYILIDLK